MGSEHYCLRWNNHQSNLLGVFSQLLQDESLVDVTLACSEGAPIRAHKVVLSACSSYFQSLFLDHPERHPIVILKDVRFTELQTLVEFMYKGEVNVQYCQLSALLKTAESLKVKGLAEMTNQNTTLREPEREPDRLRPHSQPSKSACDSPVDAALTAGGSSSASSANSANATALASSASNTAASTSASASASAAENSIHSTASTAASSTGLHKREPSDRGNTPPPTKRQQTAHDDEDDTPLPLDLYQRRIENEESLASTKTVIKTEAQARRSATPSVSGTSHAQNNGAEGRDTPALNSPTERPSPCSIGAVEKLEDDDYDEDMDLDDNDDNSSNELSNNFKRRAAAVGLLVSSPLGHSADIDSARSTPISASTSNATGLLPSDLTQRCSLARNANSGASTSTSTATGGMGAVGGLSPNTSSTITASSAVQSDTSGLGPVQSVPLSLKKEIDLSEDDNSNSRHHLQPTRSASAGGGLELDYRTTHDSMLRHFGSSLSLPATRSPTPFNFPFSPLGLNLFDLDPSRMLSLLHHQSWLAEEALRNRTLFTPPKESPHRINPLGDFYATHLHANAPASNDLPLHLPQQTPYKTNSFNVRYPSMAAFFQHQHQQEQQRKHARQNTASPLQQSSSATSTLTNNNNNNTAGSPICVSPFAKQNSTGCDLLLEELKRKSAANCDRDDDATEIIELSSPNSDVKNNNNNNNSNMMDHNKSHSFKNNMNVTNNALDQFLQQRRSASTSLLMGDNFRSYSQLFLSSSANTPSCTDTSSCKEKSSSSSTSSTPPPSAALLAQQQLSHILKSPSESSLFGDNIEEETRCVVCNAHFPNVWLLEQHAALQHPHIGPGDEKPFICEQCGQSYRYRSAYAKHKEQNHRARLPADKLFTCDVCGMQFRYLKSFKKHRLNHALERLHGKKGVLNSSGALKPASNASFGEQDVVTSTQEAMAADNCGVEDLRINIKREQEEEEAQRTREEEQDNTVDSAGMNMLYNAENSSNTASTSVTEATITSSDVIYSTNKKQRLLQSTHTEADASLHCLQQQASQTLQTPQTHLHPGVLNVAGHHMSVPVPVPVSVTMPTATMHHGHQASTSLSSLNSLSSITSLINAERLPNEQFLGLNPQEASILNFLRVDAAERQRDKRPQASRFACPFCGKCVRSKENLKLHVRKHTGERPFVCLFCGRAFGGKSDLTRHLRIHTGERPYHCESCGKCFARADYLSKHLTTHIHNAPR